MELSRCCFHHLVENSILYKKDIQHFYIGPILFSENKIIRSGSVEKLTVKFYLVPEVTNWKCYFVPGVRNGKIYLVPNDSYENFYLAVKQLNIINSNCWQNFLTQVTVLVEWLILCKVLLLLLLLSIIFSCNCYLVLGLIFIIIEFIWFMFIFYFLYLLPFMA